MDKIARATREIGRRLRAARLGAGLVLAEVAAKAGVSEGFLSKLERGQVAASIANLIQLAEALGLGGADVTGAELAGSLTVADGAAPGSAEPAVASVAQRE